eukprot:364836-Chlamydomonas_euryale.AAC.1
MPLVVGATAAAAAAPGTGTGAGVRRRGVWSMVVACWDGTCAACMICKLDEGMQLQSSTRLCCLSVCCSCVHVCGSRVSACRPASRPASRPACSPACGPASRPARLSARLSQVNCGACSCLNMHARMQAQPAMHRKESQTPAKSASASCTV